MLPPELLRSELAPEAWVAEVPALLPSHGPAELRAVAELRCRGISTPMAEFCARSPRSGRAEGPGGACAASSKLCEARIELAPALAARMRSAHPLCGQLGG